MKKISILLLSALSLSFNVKAEKIKLIIDAAHGGQDAGAKAATGEKESDLSMQFAKALQEEATKNNMEVVLVRNSDEFKALNQRNTFKPEAGVKAYYISFHMNAENSKTVRGAIIQYNGNAKDAASAQSFAEKLKDGFNLINDIGTKVNGECKAIVVKNSEIPAVIIEPGYMSNEQDLRKLKDKGIQQEIAMLIVKVAAE